MALRLVALAVATPTARVILEPPPHSVETVSDSDVDVFMRLMPRRVAPYHDLLSGNLQIRVNVVETPLTRSATCRLHNDPAADDPAKELLKLLDAAADLCLHRGRAVEVLEADLQRDRHG
jgi:hypothetical protein